MAKRITEEMKLKINELYYELGVKSHVAKALGISASSVSKYIIDGWKPESERNIKTFEGEPDTSIFINELLVATNPSDYLLHCRLLSEEEWLELEELQKEEII